MPKKHTFNLKQHQGPSSSSKPNSSKDVSIVSSVNEKLNELRKIEGPEAAARKREIAELVSQKSVPPQLRGILGVPETASPRARPGLRVRGMPRTPGPAPPKSWTTLGSGRWTATLASRKKRKGKNANTTVAERPKPLEIDRFARMIESDSANSRSSRGVASLTHHALKTVVQQWDMLDEDDYPALAELTLQLRLRLLSYMVVFGPAVSIEAFEALTQGSEQITHLDVSGLVGYRTLTLPRLTKRFRQDQPKEHAIDNDLADSWEDEDTTASLLGNGLSSSRFSHLTHLSLSHPPSNILWRDLLAFTKHTHHVTHLSLAHWPRPTLTPNLSTTTVSSHHSPDVIAGGSHIYSTIDQDMNEPAALLRQLSINLLQLQWLDLEGCASWAPALALLADSPDLRAYARFADEWSVGSATALSVIADTWKNLGHVNVAQGWLPTYAGLKALPTQQGISSDRQLVREIMDTLPVVEAETHDQLNREKQRAAMWLEAEVRVLLAMRRINNVRRSRSLSPVVMDFGWARKTR